MFYSSKDRVADFIVAEDGLFIRKGNYENIHVDWFDKSNLQVDNSRFRVPKTRMISPQNIGQLYSNTKGVYFGSTHTKNYGFEGLEKRKLKPRSFDPPFEEKTKSETIVRYEFDVLEQNSIHLADYFDFKSKERRFLIQLAMKNRVINLHDEKMMQDMIYFYGGFPVFNGFFLDSVLLLFDSRDFSLRLFDLEGQLLKTFDREIFPSDIPKSMAGFNRVKIIKDTGQDKVYLYYQNQGYRIFELKISKEDWSLGFELVDETTFSKTGVRVFNGWLYFLSKNQDEHLIYRKQLK